MIWSGILGYVLISFCTPITIFHTNKLNGLKLGLLLTSPTHPPPCFGLNISVLKYLTPPTSHDFIPSKSPRNMKCNLFKQIRFILLFCPLLFHTFVTSKCTTHCTKLLSKQLWKRQRGYWIGNYTFRSADGKPFQSRAWPYRYDTYFGFIRIEIDGPCLTQRNVFLYPPLPKNKCLADSTPVLGEGKCGRNGNEKVFEAFQTASDCDGNLGGPFPSRGITFDTSTEIGVGDGDTAIYQVRLPESAGGSIFQSQQTVTNGDTRVRSALSFVPGTVTLSTVSIFRERRVTREEWLRALGGTRRRFRILKDDFCGWDIQNMRANKTCEDHFKIGPCPFRASSGMCQKKRREYRMWKRNADRCLHTKQ